MNRKELERHIRETYEAKAEFPWGKYPNYMVFRHHDNQKWFALVMDVPLEKLGLSEKGIIDVLDVKCDPVLIGSLIKECGCYPAYHMDKTNWITVSLDGSVSDEKIKWLVDLSFNLTASSKEIRGVHTTGDAE